ncbi:hypothetical protein C2E23DRAFT_101500 [Lenzites betulinus]|nr:hypothetical protein C2E23DRAFT_101500 [Lenzites betulinus]
MRTCTRTSPVRAPSPTHPTPAGRSQHEQDAAAFGTRWRSPNIQRDVDSAHRPGTNVALHRPAQRCLPRAPRARARFEFASRAPVRTGLRRICVCAAHKVSVSVHTPRPECGVRGALPGPGSDPFDLSDSRCTVFSRVRRRGVYVQIQEAREIGRAVLVTVFSLGLLCALGGRRELDDGDVEREGPCSGVGGRDAVRRSSAGPTSAQFVLCVLRYWRPPLVKGLQAPRAGPEGTTCMEWSNFVIRPPVVVSTR